MFWCFMVFKSGGTHWTYTRMLRKALNIHWSSHIPNQQLYGELPAVSNKIASRRLQLAGHCYRHPELSTQKLVLWEPTHGHRGRGRPKTTYIDTLKRDTGAFEACDIAALIADKRLWKDLVVARLRATNEWVSDVWEPNELSKSKSSIREKFTVVYLPICWVLTSDSMIFRLC